MRISSPPTSTTSSSPTTTVSLNSEKHFHHQQPADKRNIIVSANNCSFHLHSGEKYAEAIECAKTFLLFHPEDEVMNQNLAYYSAVLGEDKAATLSAKQVRLTHTQTHSTTEPPCFYPNHLFVCVREHASVCLSLGGETAHPTVPTGERAAVLWL